MADSATRAAADAIRAQQRALANSVGSASGGTDPAYVPERELFGGYTHQEIWDQVHEVIDPAALGRVADAWRANAAAIAEAFQAFSDATNREFARWSGRSADAALRATREFVRAGAEAHDVCRAVQRLMELNSDAAQAIRAAIPPPSQYRALEDPAAEAIHGGQRRMDHDMAAATAQADVQDTMTYVYTPIMPASGDRVPRFTPPPDGPHIARPNSGSGGGAR
ncbi:hypothetical protein OG874_31415 [Nocardia sp. NBC_00565]|uniref:hypothetical protein n=1 Tax=Nocardia sp. NBC_00565 TaxID=2975993 RepID=UPI002E815818|nr:hypothetical protein [Nocardia sp. NBC_00565]WUC01285.1 hypothetical protein OG874_31415 [Nocardia sp. NBC_00565]